MLSARMGYQRYHRRRGRRSGNLDAPVPARDRPHLERNRVRRRARAARRSENCRLVHGSQNQHRRLDHARYAARENQRRLPLDARGQIDSKRGHILRRRGGGGRLMPRKIRLTSIFAIAASATILAGCWHRETDQQKFMEAMNHGNSAQASQIWLNMDAKSRADFSHSQGMQPTLSPDQIKKQLSQHYVDKTGATDSDETI